MMKKTVQIFILTFLTFINISGQVKVNGTVMDRDGQPLPGANVMIKGTYDGATADSAGYFFFETSENGKQTLVASFIGYKSTGQEIDLSQTPDDIEFILEIQMGEIKGVVISASAFETGEVKRPIILKPMDIATTPSAMGDIYGAMTTLPGTQVVGNEGGLYVRGGEGYETKTFIDGMQVANPYMSKMPDLPTRSRFSPILFTGTAFSTGGYSAEFGQALSSAINLKTTGLAEKNQGAFSVMTVGISGSYTHRWKESSVSTTLQYLNMTPYYGLFEQNMRWDTPPSQAGGTILFRQRTGKDGLLKIFGSADNGRSALYFNYKGDSAEPSLINLHNGNYYLNGVYSNKLRKDWKLKAGFSYGFDDTGTGIDSDHLSESINSFHQRITVKRKFKETVNLMTGEEASWYFYNQNYYSKDSLKSFNSGFIIGDYALYAEPEIQISDHLAARIGFRGEYLSLSDEWHFVPRLSMAYKTGDYSQVSLAYGLFSQRSENRYLNFNNDLRSEKAAHLICNYQYEVDDRIFRVEIYGKWYENLVKFESENNPDPAAYSNKGHGFSRGIDFFWRDSKSVRNLDYWLSYSYIYTKRDYRDYRQSRIPSFISPHTFSAVFKYFFSKANTYAGLTYMYASPKTYYNPSLPFSGGDRTTSYNDLSINITSIRPLFGSYCAILLNISNLLGFKNIYGYHYSLNPDAGGNYVRYPIEPQSRRFFILGGYFIFK